MAANTARIQATVDFDLYKFMEQEFLDFKLLTTLEKRAYVKKVRNMRWDICQSTLHYGWSEFLESAIRKWVADKKRMDVPLLRKEIILR